MIRRPPRSTLFPYTTLFRSRLPAQLGEIAHLRNGIILVTGPTGSGKSSTLAAIVDKMNEERAIHILTIEDPIEFLQDRKSTRLNSSHGYISYAVFCLKKKTQ